MTLWCSKFIWLGFTTEVKRYKNRLDKLTLAVARNWSLRVYYLWGEKKNLTAWRQKKVQKWIKVHAQTPPKNIFFLKRQASFVSIKINFNWILSVYFWFRCFMSGKILRTSSSVIIHCSWWCPSDLCCASGHGGGRAGASRTLSGGAVWFRCLAGRPAARRGTVAPWGAAVRPPSANPADGEAPWTDC